MRSARQSTAQHARAAQAACGRGTGGLAMNAPPARWTHIVQQMAVVSDGRVGHTSSAAAKRRWHCVDVRARPASSATRRVRIAARLHHRNAARRARHRNAPATGLLAMGSTGSARGTAAWRSGFTMGAAAPPLGKGASDSDEAKLVEVTGRPDGRAIAWVGWGDGRDFWGRYMYRGLQLITSCVCGLR